MECMCGVESNEEVRTCADELPPDEFCGIPGCNRINITEPPDPNATCFCGSWQISPEYFAECSAAPFTVSNNTFHGCALDIECSTQCVRNYLTKHVQSCFGTTNPDEVGCVELFRLHRNGPTGCHNYTPLESSITSCCGTPGRWRLC